MEKMILTFFQKLTFYLLFLFMEILYCKVSDHGSL